MEENNIYITEILKKIETESNNNILSKNKIQQIKKNVCKKYKISKIPTDRELYNYYINNKVNNKDIEKYLVTKPIRTASGVTVISIMTSPYPCPHGKCIPCPGGPNSKFESPQSYMGKEPAAMRGFQYNFDPYKQVSERLKQIFLNGHSISKVELIVMGGTFSSRSLNYQEWFIKRALEAMNEFQIKNIDEQCKNYDSSKSLNDVIKCNEVSNIRNIGTTFETRPDCVSPFQVKEFLKLGGTKIELGVQSVYNDILQFINRGHDINEVKQSNRLLRDHGFKIGFHMMLGLHNGNLEREIEEYKILFSDEDLRPDYLKIYPTLVTEGTELYELWKQKKYVPIN